MPSTFANIVVHVVFATKGRTETIEKRWRDRLHAYLGGVIKNSDAFALAVGGTADHVHVAMAIRPKHCLSDLVRDFKRASSKWVHEELGIGNFQWQEGYGAFSVSASDVEKLNAYIADQERHHMAFDSRTEFIELCREAGIEVDLTYFE
jgi:REP element-mobilizing transposase RayT